MTRIDSLRRFLLPCFSSSSTPTITTTTASTSKKRLSTSLRDDLPDPTTTTTTKNQEPPQHYQDQDRDSNNSTNSTLTTLTTTTMLAPPRPSKTLVIGTIFGTRRGRVWLCFQHNRLSKKPLLLLELSIPTHQVVKEMQSGGFVRIALECGNDQPDLGPFPLRYVPVWTLSCNGKRLGFASRRKVSQQARLLLKTMQSMTVGAGVIPSGFGSTGSGTGSGDIMYMRANYEHVVGSADSESFHLINPDECPGQELSVFLMRSR